MAEKYSAEKKDRNSELRFGLSEPTSASLRIGPGCGKPCELGCVLADSGDAGASGPSILLVESDPAAREVLLDHLREQGCRIVEAEHGGPAIRAAAAQPFDYVVVDIDWVGVSDGAALARWTCTNRPRTRVVLTSTILSHLFSAGGTMAALPLIRKPFRREDLNRVLAPVAVAPLPGA